MVRLIIENFDGEAVLARYSIYADGVFVFANTIEIDDVNKEVCDGGGGKNQP